MDFNKFFSFRNNIVILFIVSIYSVTCNALYSQCNETLLTGAFEDSSIFRCPSYIYSYTPHNKNNVVLDILDHNDIELVKNEFQTVSAQIKKIVLKTTNRYFFENLNFYSFEVVCLDSISAFEDKIPFVDLEKCKAKYEINYYFEPIENVKYCVGFLLDESLNIIDKSNFPKGKIKPFEKKSICEIKDLGRKFLNAEIKELRLIVYKNKFYWSLLEMKNYTEGENFVRNILFESADLSNYVILNKKIYSHGDDITIFED